MSDPIREFERMVSMLEGEGLTKLAACREVRRRSPKLAKLYKAAMRDGHPLAATTRPFDEELSMR